MGKGKQAQTKTEQKLPSEIAPYYKDLMFRAGRASRKPFNAYEGRRLAAYDPAEKRFQRGIESLYERGPRPELGMATSALGQAGEYAGNVPQWGSEAYEKYASPFFENVIDVEKRRIGEDWDRDLGRKRMDAVGAGAYGGSGQAMQLALGMRDKQRALEEAETTGRQRAWEQARVGFGADRDALASAANLQTQISSQLQSLAQTQQTQAFERLQSLEAMGAGRRELEQAAIDIAYQDFLDAESYERKMLTWFGSLLHGVPLGADQDVTGTPATGSQGAKIAGAVLSGIGSLASAAGSFGGSSGATSGT